jgi:hypothetical protein
VYPDARVAKFVTANFIPARIHVRENQAEWARFSEQYGVQWTPTILVLDPEGKERHRVEGFLPADELLGQLALGLGQSAFARGEFREAEKRLSEVVEQHAQSSAAPEAQYWAGVAKYKATNDASALADTATAFTRRYQDSTWAKKSSVWRQ